MATNAPSPLQPTDRTSLRRSKERAAIDRQALYDVLRGGMFCHLGVILGGDPLVLPTAYGVDLNRGPDGTLYLHGSVAARSVRAAGDQTVCVTVTHVDGLVLARSAFHHSVNYRSAVIYGMPRLVTDPEEKLHGLNTIVDHLVPGRSGGSRPPNRKELVATSVLALPLTEASVKSRSGGANDDEQDLDLPYWTGVIPLRVVADEPVTNDDCDLLVPAHVRTRANVLGAPSTVQPVLNPAAWQDSFTWDRASDPPDSYDRGMALDLFAGIPVSEYAEAVAWYERLLGSPPSFLPNDVEAVWELAEHRYVYIKQLSEHAGHAEHTIFVDDLDARVAAITERGIEPVNRETYSNGVRKVTYRDPYGNEIGFGGAPL